MQPNDNALNLENAKNAPPESLFPAGHCVIFFAVCGSVRSSANFSR